jgi:hypothetical protein
VVAAHYKKGNLFKLLDKQFGCLRLPRGLNTKDTTVGAGQGRGMACVN